MTIQVTVMSGQMGDIFWDLPSWMAYASGYDLGCNIYVANPTDRVMEYALMARLVRNGQTLTEEALPVFGYTWFKVEPGDFITLKGALRFNDSDADLTVQLIEKESGEVADAVTTRLITTENTAVLPPAWPGSTGSSGTDWSSLFTTLFPFVMLGIVAAMLLRPQKEPLKPESAAKEKGNLSQGRESYAG
jgi:hypothetical protein